MKIPPMHIFVLIVIFIFIDNNFHKLHANISTAQKIQKKRISIKIDINAEKLLQKEVDAGHQPWRLRTIDVAIAAIAEIKNEQIPEEMVKEISNNGKKATVRCRGKKNYILTLNRLISPTGIWTAVFIDQE